MKPKTVFYRTLVASLFFATLIVASVALVPPVQAEEKEFGPPKLVWERSFQHNITAAGLDEDCFAPAKGEIEPCLKWILFGWSLYPVGENCKVASEPLRGHVYPEAISNNGRYFLSQQAPPELRGKENWVRYKLRDWSGGMIWETNNVPTFPVVWDDGTVVVRPRFPGAGDSCSVEFLNTHDGGSGSPKLQEVHGDRLLGVALSESLLVIATIVFNEGYEVSVFDKAGHLVWQSDRFRGKSSDEKHLRSLYTHGGVAVSDRGEVILLIDNNRPQGTQIFVFDQKGSLTDTLLLYPTGILYPLKIHGRYAFVSAGAYPGTRSHFLCYDLEQMKLKLLLEAEEGRGFGNFDVNDDASLLAVALHTYDQGHAVRVYDLEGHQKSEVPVRVHSHEYFWLRMLGNSLLTAEENKLRLYDLNKR